ncbi:DNA polymerase III subunit beta [Actinopolyspora halophila]|uniref:DNA polymerase III subunit beta n=1 Tax=Actinopolyspora halophila TaxID=1850 RepID=UPI000362973D|nr:DNA polymerase III subunit beta [Actinopolyspora halophila]
MTSATAPSTQVATNVEVSMSRGELLGALRTVGVAIDKRHQVPVLQGVCVDVDDDGGITVIGSDYESAVLTRLGGTVVAGPGRMVIHHAVLTQMVTALGKSQKTKEAAAMPVTLRATSSTAELLAEGYQLPLAPLPAEDYPAVTGEFTTWAEMDRAVFAEHAARVATAAEKDQGLAFLTGVLCTVTGGQLRMAATDRFRLATSDLTATTTLQDEQPRAGILPTAVIDTVAKHLSGQRLRLGGTETGLLTLSTETTTVVARPPAEACEFPPWEKLLPTGSSTLRLDRASLLAAASRGKALLSATDGHTVILRISDEQVALVPGLGQNPEEVAAPSQPVLEGSDVGWIGEIHLHAARLVTTLHTLRSEVIDMMVTTDNRPVMLRDDDGFRHLLMPIRKQT